LPAANDKLREARQRTASPTYPDECLSRQELAELVNAWIWEHRKKQVELSANYIGQLERGKIRWPSKLYREAFRAVFSVPTDSALGFINARSRRARVKLDDVKRKQFLETAALGVGALALGEPLAALLDGGEPTPIPHRIGATEIDQIRTVTQVFSSWSSTYGGGLARDAVMGQLRWSASLLEEASCPTRLRPELYSAVGILAATAGYMAEDAGALEEARRIYRFALGCAEQAKDWNLRAEILSSTAKQEMRAGKPDEGLTLAEQALVRADWLTATQRALLHTDRARTLAKMHRVQEALTAIGIADEHFAHSTPGNEPPYMADYSAARHDQLTGQALAELAILGRDPSEATDRLTAAATGHPKDFARSQAICLAQLASLTMATGDPLQAASIGHQALDVASALHSRRATEELRALNRYAITHQQLEEVAHLRHRIGTLGRVS
jgi:transcriptional regulator with XRE-family HTH domain